MNTFARRSVIRLAALAAIIMLAGAADAHSGSHSANPQTAAAPANAKIAAAKADLRDLWVDHIFWVRVVVFSSFDRNKAAAAAAERAIVDNAKDIAGAIEPFYGKDASGQLFELLAGHYGAVKAYLEATIKQDTAGQRSATDSLTSNAEKIAVFLSGANPYLPHDTLAELLSAHGGHHIQQIQEVQAAAYDKEAVTWAAMKSHIYTIADALADALAQQFPEQF